MKRPSCIEIYRTGTADRPGVGDWRWRITAANGRIIGASTEGYERIPACRKNLFDITGINVLFNRDNVAGETFFKAARGVKMWAGVGDLRGARACLGNHFTLFGVQS